MAGEWVQPLDVASVCAPSAADLAAAAKRSASSAPGPDGLPRAAWGGAGAAGADALERVSDAMLQLFGPPRAFLETLAVYLPMGEQAGDEDGAGQAPGDTRPIRLKKCDDKLTCAVWNFKMRRTTAKRAREAQRGFVVGRTITLNPVHLDAAGRIYGIYLHEALEAAVGLLVLSSCVPIAGTPQVAYGDRSASATARSPHLHGCPLQWELCL